MTFPATNLISAEDFSSRWQRARCSVLSSNNDSTMTENISEIDLISRIQNADKQKEILRKVFEVSKKLGHSAKWYYGIEWEAEDFKHIFSEVPVNCFSGTWMSIQGGVKLERPGCEIADKCGAFGCNYFREAMDGLSLGLTDEVTYTRHSSKAHGGSKCVDLFLLPEAANQMRFGPLPKVVDNATEQIEKQLSKDNIRIEFLGEREGIVFYQWASDKARSCQDYSMIVNNIVENVFNNFKISYNTKDITPRAVLSPGAELNVSNKETKTSWNQIIS
jgi:hypothetical protein